jgi:tetratricopeptide (TPR) repeat protein
MTGRFRWKSIIAIFGALCVLGVGLFFLHRYQMKGLNLRFKDHAERAIESGKPDRALRFYKLYLSMRRDDNDARAKFADLLGTAPGGEWSALKVYEEILRSEPNKTELRKKAGELSLLSAYLDGTPKQLEKLDNAIDHFKKYCEAKPSDAEARLMLGLTYREKARSRSLAAQPNAQKAIAENVANAKRQMQEAIRSKPSLIDGHVFLSELVQKTGGTLKDTGEAKKAEEATKGKESGNGKEAKIALDHMIDQNPEEFRAYLERARFLMGLQTEASLAQAAKDLEKAREIKTNKKEELLLSAQLAILSPIDVKAQDANEKVLQAEREKLDKARAILKKAAELYPKDDAILSALARMEWAAGNPKQAIELQRSAKKHATKTEVGEFASLLDQLLHRYTEKFATKVRRQEIAVFLATMLIADGQYPEAKEVLDEAESLGVQRSRLNVMRGEIEFRKGNWRSAAEYFDFARTELSAELLKADEKKRKEITGLLFNSELLLSNALGSLSDRDGRINALQRAKKFAPLNAQAEVLALLVNSYERAGRTDEAREAAKELARLRNNDAPEVLVELNSVFRNAMSRPKDPQSWAPFHRLVDRFPEKPFAVVSLEVLAFIAQEKFDQARELLKRTKNVEKEDEAYRRNLMAEVEFSDGKSEDAFKILDDAIREKVKPTHALIRAKLNFLTRAPKPSTSSILAIESEIPLAETSEQASLYQTLGLTMNAFKDSKNADRFLRKALELEPNSLPLHLVVLDFYWRNRDRKSLDGIVSAISKIDGKDSPVTLYSQSLSLITKARPNPLSDESKRDLAEAKRLLTAASLKRPTEPKFPEAMAVIASLEDDNPSKFAYLEKASKLGSRDPEVRAEYFGQLLRLNRIDEAVKYVENLPPSDQTLGVKRVGLLTRLDVGSNSGDADDLLSEMFNPDSTEPDDHVFHGTYLRMRGKSDEARKAFEKANQLAPTLPTPLIFLVAFLANENKIDEAKKAVDSRGGLIAPEARAMTLATCYVSLKQPDNVKAILTKELQKNGSKLETLLLAKKLYLEIGELQKGEELLQRILSHEKAPESLKAQARRELARLTWQQARQNNVTVAMSQKHRDALETIEKNLKVNPTSEEDLYEKAMLLAVQPESRADAIQILERIYTLRNPTPEQDFTLAEIYDLEGNWNKARDNYLKFARSGSRIERYLDLLPVVIHKLIAHDEMPAAEEVIGRLSNEAKRRKEIAPKSEEPLRVTLATLHVRGEFELKRKDASAFEKLFREQLGKKDLDAKAQTQQYFALGGVLTDLARRFPEQHAMILKKGKSILDDAVPANPEPRVALVTAEFLAACGAVDEALQMCETSVGKAEAAQVGRVAIAAVCGNPEAKVSAEQRKRVDRMLSTFQTANPKSVEIKTLKAVFDEQQKRYDDAKKAYQALIDQNPANVVAANNLAVLLALQGRSAEAIKLIDPFIEQYRIGRLADNGELLDSRALILLQAGDLKRAEQDIRESVAQSRDPGRLFHMAQIYAAMGNTSRSRSIFLEARRMGLRPENLHPLERPKYEEMAADSR